MELRQLRHFIALIEHRTMHAAAQAFGITQPALTRSIQALERDMNVKLLTRHARRVVPTTAGHAFFLRAQLILNECNRAQADALALQEGHVGEVHIGIGMMFSTYLMNNVIAKIATTFPNLQIKVTEGFYEELLARIEIGSLDLVFTNFAHTNHDANTVADPLTTLHGSAFVRAGHRLTTLAEVTPADTTEEHWLVIGQPHATEHFSRIFDEHELPTPRRVLTTNSIQLIKSIMTQGDFITYIPKEFLLDEIASGQLSMLNFPACTYERKAGLIYRKDQKAPAALQVADAIRQACKDMPQTA